jgi:hypothetical protein
MSLATLLNIDATRNFLQDGEVYDALVEVAEKHQLPDDRVNEFLDLTDAVFDGQVPLSEIPALLAEAFGISEDAAKALAVEIAGIRMLPLEVFFPGVAEQMTAWGGDVAQYGGPRIQKEGIRAEDLAQQVSERAGVVFSDLLMKRLAFLIEQRVNGQKSDESLRTFFGRPLTIGGMGLVKEQIDALMNAVSDAVIGVRIITDEEHVAAQKIAEEKAVSAVAVPTSEQEINASASLGTSLEISPSHELAAEVPVISSPVQEERRESVAKPLTLKIATPLEEKPELQDKKKAEKAKKLHDEAIKTAFKDAVDFALEKAHSLLGEAHIQPSAFADIAGKMLRGVRDQYQTRDVLEREYRVKTPAIPGLMQALLSAEEAYRVAVDSLSLAQEQKTSVSDEEAQILEEGEAKRREEKFTELTKDSPKPEKAIVELTMGSVPLAGSAQQKRVTDVVAGNKLMGPIEQLGTLALADFRRLSTNPDEAVRKMEALLDALQKTSYEERIRGILAWRKSPLAKLHIALMTESLNTGVAVAEIAARRRTQGQESLGPAEMQALAKWNEKTRF